MPRVEVTASGISSSQARETDRDVRTLDDVGEKLRPVGAEIDDDIDRQMHAGVEKREHPEHAAEAHEFGAPGQPAQRRDRQRREQQAQRPVAAAVLECGDRIGAEAVVQRIPCQPRQRHQACREQQRLERGDVIAEKSHDRVRSESHQKFRRRSMPA